LTIPSIGLSRGLWNAPERFIETYWSKIPDLWIHGDFASVDQKGYWYVHGRSDDTIKIAGKRTGPSEIEAALLATGKVAEAAVIGVPDDIKGSAVVCVCVPARGVSATPELADSLKRAVVAALGASFRPKAVAFVSDVPKTRSMKIMRRVVRAVWLGQVVGDLSGLVNPEAVDDLKAVVAAREA
jgi:acetyl-CoA synthetase